MTKFSGKTAERGKVISSDSSFERQEGVAGSSRSQQQRIVILCSVLLALTPKPLTYGIIPLHIQTVFSFLVNSLCVFMDTSRKHLDIYLMKSKFTTNTAPKPSVAAHGNLSEEGIIWFFPKPTVLVSFLVAMIKYTGHKTKGKKVYLAHNSRLFSIIRGKSCDKNLK